MSTSSYTTTSTDPQFLDFCDDVARRLADLPIPGASLGIWHAGEQFTAAFGVTSLENPLPVTPDTLFQVGSITKTFLATAIMRLVEQGRLDLDAPLRTYLPDLKMSDPQVAAQVNMRHLLSHTGGWVGDFFDDCGGGDDALARMVARVSELPQVTPLGEIYSYNNAGFYLAGRVLEVLTGKPFEAAMHSLVLAPLELSMSFFSLDDIITRRFAVGHQVIEKQPVTARPWAVPRAVAPAGGLVSTVPDLLRYARFHCGVVEPGGELILSPASLEQMQTPLQPSTGINSIALTWMISPAVAADTGQDAALPVIGHGGATRGQMATLQIVPSRRFAFAMLTNSDEGDRLYQPVSALALERYTGLSLPQTQPLPQPDAVLSGLQGDYEAYGSLIHLRLQNGDLAMDIENKGGFPTPDSPPSPNPPTVRLGVYAPDRVIVLDDPLKNYRGEFLRNPDGSIAWFRFSGRVHKKLGITPAA